MNSITSEDDMVSGGSHGFAKPGGVFGDSPPRLPESGGPRHVSRPIHRDAPAQAVGTASGHTAVRPHRYRRQPDRGREAPSAGRGRRRRAAPCIFPAQGEAAGADNRRRQSVRVVRAAPPDRRVPPCTPALYLFRPLHALRGIDFRPPDRCRRHRLSRPRGVPPSHPSGVLAERPDSPGDRSRASVGLRIPRFFPLGGRARDSLRRPHRAVPAAGRPVPGAARRISQRDHGTGQFQCGKKKWSSSSLV